VHRQPELLEVVGTAHPRRGLAHLLHGREQQADEDRDEGDHHQQFDEREPAPRTVRMRTHDVSLETFRNDENREEMIRFTTAPRVTQARNRPLSSAIPVWFWGRDR
jgi:hypothetical protein